jgi:hypothetical protein
MPSSADVISTKGAPVHFLCDLACSCALLALGRCYRQKKTLLVTNYPASGIAYTTKAGECRDTRLDGRRRDMVGRSVHVHAYAPVSSEHQMNRLVYSSLHSQAERMGDHGDSRDENLWPAENPQNLRLRGRVCA